MAEDVRNDPEPEARAAVEHSHKHKATRPGNSLRSRLLIGGVCAALGFGIVVQVRHTQADEFSSLRQDDLVRLLDEVTQLNEDLMVEADQLRIDRAELLSGSDARQIAEEYARLQGILAGTLPVEGPGVVVTVEDPGADVTAQAMVHMLEELRNAGAEGIELSGQRLTASSSFTDGDGGVLVDGTLVTSPYEWRAIGNPQTISVALEIPGGALASFRNVDARVDLEQRDLVQITAIRILEPPTYATPVEDSN